MASRMSLKINSSSPSQPFLDVGSVALRLLTYLFRVDVHGSVT